MTANTRTGDTPNIVRAAITQTTWTGDKESMIDKHEQFARDAAAAGRPGHLLPGAVLRPVLRPRAGREVLRLRRAVPTARSSSASQALAARARHGDGAADLRGGAARASYYNTAAVVDADGTLLGKYRKHHIPHLTEFWEKFYFRPGNLGYPVFDTAVGKVGVYICYDRHFPEGWRELGLNGAQIVFNPHATKPGLSNRLWEIEQPAAAVANEYFVARPTGSASRTRVGDDAHFYGTSHVRRPARATSSASVGSRHRRGARRPRPRPGPGHARCATTGSSTATAARTPTRSIAEAVGRQHGTTLITRRHRRLARPAARQADVLVDGETHRRASSRRARRCSASTSRRPPTP